MSSIALNTTSTEGITCDNSPSKLVNEFKAKRQRKFFCKKMTKHNNSSSKNNNIFLADNFRFEENWIEISDLD